MRGLWAQRHIESLASDPAFYQVVECTKEYHKQQQEAIEKQDSSKMRSAVNRNKVCMCHAVCQDETMAWLQCVKGEMKKHRGDREAGFAAQRLHCEEKRRLVESCTQWESTRLLHLAVLPPPQERQEVF